MDGTKPGAQLAIGIYNLSVLAVKKHPDKVKAVIDKFATRNENFVLGCNEAGQADWLEDWCHANNFGYWGGDERPAKADPIIWNLPDAIRKTKSRLLTDRTFVGRKPAGSSTHAHPKYLNEISFWFGGRYNHVACFHKSPSIWWPPNRRLNLRQSENAADYLENYNSLTWVVGDRNHRPDHKFNKPFEMIGLTSAQLRKGTIATFGNRSIDDVHGDWDSSRCSLIATGTIPGAIPKEHKLFYTINEIH